MTNGETVVMADWCITTPAILIQPLTGWLLMRTLGYDFGALWLQLSLLLYGLAGLCWLPVVWLQIRMRDIAAFARRGRGELPPRFWRHARIWELLGYPAFAAMLAIYGLMVFRPSG